MIQALFSLPRAAKTWIALVADSSFLFFSIWLALSLRFEAAYIPSDSSALIALVVFIVSSIIFFRQAGLYRAIVRYMGVKALAAVCGGVLASAGIAFIVSRIFGLLVPISALFSYMLMALLLIGGSRLFIRTAVNRQYRRYKSPVIVYGAGASGRQLAQALTNGAEFKVVAFVDDDKTLHGSTMLGITVYPSSSINELISDKSAQRLLLAMPSATRAERKAILEDLESVSIQIQSIPGMSDLVDGQKIDSLQEINIEDLLGRDPVPPIEHLMGRNIREKVVVVTGAGGSIGSELCRQIIRLQPSALILLELSEYSLYAVESELKAQIQKEKLNVKSLVPIIGNVEDTKRMKSVMQAFSVQTVFHAAAYKHVPMMEYNVIAAVKNNIFGTWRLAEAAIESAVESFVLVSTDKAVRPTNVMGATKRMSELVLQALATRQDWTCFSMVRFGNVLGSSGSVIPKFRQQIMDGGPVTVTDKEITRFFMTIPEAAQLVIQAGAMSFEKHANEGVAGGDVYILDMGEPVKIAHLAQKLISLMGKSVKDASNPNGDIEIKYSGLRPGEKLYEELLIGEQSEKTEHPRIMAANEVAISWEEVEALLASFEDLIESMDVVKIRELLEAAPLVFTPSDAMSDLVWRASAEVG